MRAGPLRHRVTVKQLVVASTDPGWGDEKNWQQLMIRPAEVTAVKGNERLMNRAVNSSVEYFIRMRYTDKIKPEHRIEWGDLTLDIVAIVSPGNTRRELHIQAKVAGDE